MFTVWPFTEKADPDPATPIKRQRFIEGGEKQDYCREIFEIQRNRI